MRKALLAIVGLQGLIGFEPSAHAQYYFVPPLGGQVQGVGCYWYRGQHYCSRYCYMEVDGYHYCQRRLRDAGSQAPPPVALHPPSYWRPRPNARTAPHRHGSQLPR